MKENGNKFLENEIRKTDVLLTTKSGEEQITLVYPNLQQSSWIKNELYNNRFRIMENGGLFTQEVNIYRYILKNLCDMDNLNKYSDIELMDILTNGKLNVKRLKNRIDDLMYELFYDIIEENKVSVNALESTLLLIDSCNDEVKTNRLLEKVLKDNNVDVDDVDTKEQIYNKIKELVNNIKENLSK